jgi:hypothetical protein
MRDIICNHHPLRRLQINSLLCHQNTNKGHTTGVLTVLRILRDIGTMGMIEVITDMTEGITGMTDIILMIEDTSTMIEDITTMIEAITLMIEDIILMIEDTILMRELLGGQCTMRLTGEDILFRQVLFLALLRTFLYLSWSSC